jgi:hypothetical protein
VKRLFCLAIASALLLVAFPGAALGASKSVTSTLAHSGNTWVNCNFTVAYQPNFNSPSYWVVSNLNWNATNQHMVFSQTITFHDARVLNGTSVKINKSCSTAHTIKGAPSVGGKTTVTHNFPAMLVNVIKGSTYGSNHNHGNVGVTFNYKNVECTGNTATFN